MSVSLLEVIEAGGYNLDTREDAKWLLSKQMEFDELIEQAEAVADTCDHENTTTEIVENTAEYEYNQGIGNTSYPLTQTEIIVCGDCGAVQDAEGNW